MAWTCPYCNQIATLLEENRSHDQHTFTKGNKDGQLTLYTTVTVCPNNECKEYTIYAGLSKSRYMRGNFEYIGEDLQTWQLKPQSEAKPFPDYIPDVILADYKEACLIRDLSPKASATLSRRCLQGIIRDFWGIKNGNLAKAIIELEDKINDPTTWSAIDAVRQIGNIGAHMEKDINLIVDVDPEEAGMLIDLIESLLEEWYIQRHNKNIKMQKIIEAAASKKVIKEGVKAIAPPAAILGLPPE
ncbi:MAG: DUF4145 domain-containing protein [Polaromonas sp.]|nr:DUF4145 domain-containing protein [Polaromonas sp.]